MTQYNLIKSGFIESVTSSGTGNKDLDVDERCSLYDENTTSSGISLVNTDILYIDIDLLNRIRIDDVNLYIGVPGDRNAALVKVDFYYKNLESDTYILCSKEQNLTTFYPINLPDLFAPQFIRIVIDTLESDIFELIVTNDDTQVAFGEDGNKTLIDIDHEDNSYNTLEIFNNSSDDIPVTAYVIVDYKKKESDYYIKLATSAGGEYKGLGDGNFIANNDHSSKHTWSEGYFDGTRVDADSVVIDPNSIDPTEAYYTTPVLTLGDPLMSSFLITEQTPASGTNITWTPSSNEPTVKIRSSNIEPLPLTKLYITREDTGYIYIYECGLSDGSTNSIKTFYQNITGSSMKFDRLSGTFVVVHGDRQITRYKFNAFGDDGVITNSVLNSTCNINNNWGIDGNGNVWGYSSSGAYKLRIFASESLTETTLLDNGIDECVVDLAPNMSYASCWFTDPSVKMLKHMDSDGTLLFSKSLDNPTYICSLHDGGCLVVDAGKSTINRYNYTGELQKEISFLSSLEILDISCEIYVEHTLTLHNRFWVLTTTGYVLQYDFDGNIISDCLYGEATSIHAFFGGCLVHCQGLKKTYQLNSLGEASRVWDYSTLAGTMGIAPDAVHITYTEYLELLECDSILPLNTDPVWGHSVVDTWEEVISDGYLLPFSKYHQLKYKFNGEVLDVPIINPGAELDTGWDMSLGYPDYSTAWAHSGLRSFGVLAGAWVNGTFTQMIDLTTVSGIDFDFLDQQGQLGRNGYIFSLNWFSFLGSRYSDACISTTYYDASMVLIPNTAHHFESQPMNDWIQEGMFSQIVSNTRYINIQLYLNRYSNAYCHFDDLVSYITLSPKLDLINIPEPIKIPDIAPQEYKNIYIKSEPPVGASYGEYETELRCWWGNKEE